MSDDIDITNVKLAYRDMGELWTNFEVGLNPETATIFNSSYNLIALILEEDNLQLDISYVIINDELDFSMKVNDVRNILIQYLIGVLGYMGITIDSDYVTPESLYDLVNILNTIYSIDNSEDLLGLYNIITNEDLDTKERFIEIIIKVNDLEDDGVLPFMIKSVAQQTLIGIGENLDLIDDGEGLLDDVIKNRIRNNRETLKDTLGYKYLIDGGKAATSFTALFNIHDKELADLLLSDSTEYFKNILSLLIISDLTTEQIQESFETGVKDYSETTEALYKNMKILENVTLE